MRELLQSADWKSEKHVPVIDAPENVQAGESVRVSVAVGKEIPHPNTTEHHIGWIEVYFHPDGEKFPYLIGRHEFSAHGASAQGPNTSTVYTQPEVTCVLKTEKSGTLLAVSYCNVHGLWTSSARLTVG
ncbi:MAG: class II SORL domain-containing protein [Thermoplasmata archaeon]|nr:class II SORL domain-containing protein [Thermoplasmata archaeon]